MRISRSPLKVLSLTNDILYGTKPPYKEITLFKDTTRAVKKITLLKDHKRIFEEIAALPTDEHYSYDNCVKLSEYLNLLIPEDAFYRYSFDVKKVLLILQKVWQTFEKHSEKSKDVIFAFGLRLQRVYEHLSEYEKACKIGEKLTVRANNFCSKHVESIELNNWGFDLALAGRHDEAIEKYEKALNYFRGTFNDVGTANVMANHFFSERYTEPFKWKKNILYKVTKIKCSLNNNIHKRKALLAEAMYCESNSNFKRAIELTKEAIEESKKNNTYYDEIDSKYLEYLKCQQTVFFKLREKETKNDNF